MWQVLFIYQCTLRLHEQFLFENERLETGIYGWHQKNCQFLFICQCTPRLHEQFLLKTKDWRLESTDDIKKIANFMFCLVYTDKTNTPVFQQI